MLALALTLLQDQPDPAQIQRIVMTMIPLIGIFVLIAIAIIIIPVWFICKKAGFSPWLSFLCLVPTVGILILLYVLAFADWKVVPVQQMAYAPPVPPYPPQR